MRPKNLISVAGSDVERIRDRLSGRNGALIFERTSQIDRRMVATDVAITKTNRNSVYELLYFGVPNIAITFGINPIDEQASRRWRPSLLSMES